MRSCTISISVTEGERNFFARLAAERETTMSSYVREAALKAARGAAEERVTVNNLIKDKFTLQKKLTEITRELEELRKNYEIS